VRFLKQNSVLELIKPVLSLLVPVRRKISSVTKRPIIGQAKPVPEYACVFRTALSKKDHGD
jgi:hypothetical protein